MIDSTQIILVASITIMTAILTVVAFQLILVLKEIRQFFSKINHIIFQLEKIGEGISSSYAEIIGFVYGLKNLIKVVDFFNKKKDKDHVKEK